MHIRGPLLAVQGEDIGLNKLLENIRYVSFSPGGIKKAFHGVTEHSFPLSENDALSFRAGLNQLITQYKIQVNKLLIAIPLTSYVHILNSTDHYFLGDASTLLIEREDLAGSGVLTYDGVKATSYQIDICTELTVINIQVCEYLLEANSTWAVYRDVDASSVFTTNTSEWVSFESPQTLMQKVDD
jgi:hypothetical protein